MLPRERWRLRYRASVFRNDSPAARGPTPKFSATKPDFNRDQFGLSLGGPITKDRTFFFANYAYVNDYIPGKNQGSSTIRRE